MIFPLLITATRGRSSMCSKISVDLPADLSRSHSAGAGERGVGKRKGGNQAGVHSTNKSLTSFLRGIWEP